MTERRNFIKSAASLSAVTIGNAWNSYQIIYDNVKLSYHSTQLGKQFGDVCASFIVTRGIAWAHYSVGVCCYAVGRRPGGEIAYG